MLIVCAGPDSYRAKQKLHGYVASFREKYDKSGKSIEVLSIEDPLREILARLSSPSLFSAKTMVVCEGLLDGLKVGQLKSLAKALILDADQTVVLDYEDKKPSQKTQDYFTEKSLLLYSHDLLEGTALKKEVVAMCQKYAVDQKMADKLLGAYSNDLWSIDSILQVASAGLEGFDLDETSEQSVFQISEDVMKGNASWMKNAKTLDKDDVVNVLVNQYRSWHLVQGGAADGVHPFVQKKMSWLKLENPHEKTLAAMRALYSARNSISTEQDTDTLIY